MEKIVRFRKKRAFTLIEVIIAMSVFSLVMLVGLNAYVFTFKGQKEADLVRKAIIQVRDGIKLIENDLKEMEIDYFCYNNFNTTNDSKLESVRCNDFLHLSLSAYDNVKLIDAEGKKMVVYNFINGSLIRSEKVKIAGNWGGVRSENVLLGGEVDGWIEILPDENPYLASNKGKWMQPMVNFGFKVKVGNTKKILTYQSGISNRNYR